MLVVDVEGTGLDFQKLSLLSIGAIDLNNPSNTFYEECRIWQGAHVDPESLKYNGFTIEEINDPTKKSEEEILKDFINWASILPDFTFAGQNVFFDYECLRQAAMRYHLNWPFAQRIIDVHSVCLAHMIKKGIIPPLQNHHSSLNSDAVCQYVGIPAEPKPHRTPLGGAKWEAEALSRLLYDKNLLEEFAQYSIPWIK
ncbi:MAG TPA: exonuclease domain-containing protein [Candidatus Paceibacterota bacterium]|nr:exonuclease domain-containing protein [Candidatus Paceibacterota bacterium]